LRYNQADFVDGMYRDVLPQNTQIWHSVLFVARCSYLHLHLQYHTARG
jgi:hypothetical protein